MDGQMMTQRVVAVVANLGPVSTVGPISAAVQYARRESGAFGRQTECRVKTGNCVELERRIP
jgi:hypothetical protein